MGIGVSLNCATICVTGICAAGCAVAAGIIFVTGCVDCAGIVFALVADATDMFALIDVCLTGAEFIFARVVEANEIFFCVADTWAEFGMCAEVVSDAVDAARTRECCARV